MSEEKWFDDSDDFRIAAENVEAIATGYPCNDSYRPTFKMNTLYFEGDKVRQLFEAYVFIKRQLKDNLELLNMLQKTADQYKLSKED